MIDNALCIVDDIQYTRRINDMTNVKTNTAVKNANDKSPAETKIEQLCFAAVARELNVPDELIKRSRAFARRNAKELKYDVIRNKTFTRTDAAYKIAVSIANAFLASMKPTPKTNA
jgi:hypothetical protein